MILDASQVIESYRKYGFEYKKQYSNSSYLTFTFKSGFFHNAEVVKINKDPSDTEDIKSKINSLNDLGVSAKITEYNNLSDIEDGLFKGFFDVDSWRKRIQTEYNDYVDSVIQSYPQNGKDLTYSYINAPFTLINQSEAENTDIIQNIINALDADNAQLILIEAPAGFGKTCTSYELIKKLVDDESKPIPFFTEFSRDRQARIFSHVFIREVDRAFSQVKSNVVQDELKNGRIVMVLDGFDELLSDTQKLENVDDYENAEPMLETISELLCNKAKIIITSRKSAIFDGATFSEWIDRHTDKFSFIRYRIDSPRIEDWLTENRRNSLDAVGLDLKKLSNPVLLSYLRFVNEARFDKLCQEPNEIVNRYFTSMLEREQERQNLLMSPSRQSDLLTKLAADMCAKNYTSDSKDKIIDFFKQKCNEILEETRKLYKPSDRPTLDSLSNTLSNHAFFDRSNQGEGRIEFINEFVFGNYIAADILSTENEWIASDERFVEPAIISFIPRTNIEREALWDGLQSMVEFLSKSDQMKYELSMLGQLVSPSYNQSSIMSIDISDIHLFENVSVNEITFTDCIFTNVTFFIENIRNATFINCKLYNCTVHGDMDNNSESFLFLNSIDNNDIITHIEHYDTDSENEGEAISELTNIILSRFWRLGSANIDRLHIPLVSIYKTCQAQGYSKRDITLELKRLKTTSILEDANDGEYIAINRLKIADIKIMLGK